MREIKKVVTRLELSALTSRHSDLSFWLKQTPEERVSAVESLRRQYYEHPPRLQRTAHITKLS